MTVTFRSDAIPAVLQQYPNWVLWKDELVDGRLTKPPYTSTGLYKASSTNPANWVAFSEAVHSAVIHHMGIGFVLTNTPFTGIDFDGCRNPETGEIDEWAMTRILEVNSYSEVSPSGTGVKVFVAGKLPGPAVKVISETIGHGGKHRAIELYDTGRYFTITGDVLEGLPKTVEQRDLTEFYAEVKEVANATPALAPATDRQKVSSGQRHKYLLHKAGQFLNDGLGPEALEIDLLRINREECYPPKDEKEVRRLAQDTYKRYHVSPKVVLLPEAVTAPSVGLLDWPRLSPEALYGIAGELVAILEPATEADPVALLVQFLTEFGNLIGHEPHAMVESTRHSLNLFSVLVGKTGHGRKGTAFDRVTDVTSQVDRDWYLHHIESGMTSGEGLAWAVRDGDGNKDSGVADKRLLVVETEFASVLKNMGREGNILSPMCRQAWDSGFLRTLNKRNPVKATGAHISIIGHITREELLRNLTETEMASGFGNRFLWFAVKRSKYLPEGGTVDLPLYSLLSRLGRAKEFAAVVQRIEKDPLARKLWEQLYKPLVDVPPGLVGALISRGAPIVLRLAAIYALLDECSEIKVEHLSAAIAVWEYAQASVRYIFGETLGDPTADHILEMLRMAEEEGLSRTEISDGFQRHLKSAEIDRALSYLVELNRIEKVTVPTGGRPIEKWRLRK